MTCASCGSEHGPDARFCESCGAPVAAHPCPVCGSATSPGKPYCGQCGARLAESPAPDAAAADAVHLIVRLGPGGHPSRVVADARSGGAALAQAGDGVLSAAWSGAGLRAAAEGAVRCALELRRRRGPSAAVARAGIALDPAAARSLCRGARHGEILLSEEVARLVAPAFRVRPARPSRPAPGASSAAAYELSGQGPRRSPRDGLGPRLHTPFVGRRREIGQIATAVERAADGEGGLIGIVGEPGIGKSRLLYEARRRLSPGRTTYLEGRCAPYGRRVPLLPMVDVLRANCGITPGETTPAIVSKVQAALAELELDARDSVPYLLRVLGLPEAEDALDGVSPEAVRARTLDLLARMALAGARRRLLVLGLEDLHWVDRTTEDLLGRLAPNLTHNRLLVLCTYRSGYEPPWRRASRFRELHLEPLPEEDAGHIVNRALGARGPAADLVGAIVERGGGNPLFLEELARAIRDGPRSAARAGVPSTLADALAARLQRLPGDARSVLQVAAVLGRRFPADLLPAIAGEGVDAGEAVRLLERQEFLVAGETMGEPTLSFTHVLVQEAAYDSLAPARRRALHAVAAEALERRSAGRPEEVTDILADHWSRAERADRAVEFLSRSAARSASGYAHAEAERALARALVHADALDAAERDEAVVALAVRRAHSQYFLGAVQESVDLLLPLEERAAALDDRRRLAELRFWLGHAYSHLGAPESAASYALAAERDAERASAPAIVGRARYVRAREGWWTGRWREGVAAGRTAVPLLEGAGEGWWAGHCLCYIGHGHHSLGEFEQALSAVRTAQAIGEALGDPRLQSFASWSEGWYLALMGDAEAGVSLCARAVALSPDPVNSAWALGFIGFAHREAGDLERAIDELGRSIAAVRTARHPRVLCWFEGWLADALTWAGRAADGRRSARSAIASARRVGCPWAEAYAERALGRVALAEGRAGPAERRLARARARYEGLEARFEAGVTALDQVAGAEAAGDGRAARAFAEEARVLLEPLPVPRWHERLRARSPSAPGPASAAGAEGGRG